MKVVFVASGNKSVGTVSAFVRSQYESLQREGLDMQLFPIKGKGWKAYGRAMVRLRRLVRRERPDVVHAHYSVCGVVAALATCCTKTKVVVSILGSFPSKTFKLRWVRFFIKHVWDATIVKSQRTANQLGIDLPVIPNGVNLEQFAIVETDEARRRCGFEEGKKYVIWCSHPSRGEKKYPLAQQAVSRLNDPNVVLYPVFDKSHDEVVNYMCAADVLLLTSVCEGSPNVIKEAMACNCPVVSTDVGDVKWVTEGVEGTCVVPYGDVDGLAKGIAAAISYGKRTRGREKILSLGLTTKETAEKIKAIYDTL
ncbi:MAG: glycosyltransferase family 4 protein [Bacteroidales bacterium]|nr:glycosyltransferase family 4 protein [Bacteroidales bacterium]